MTNDVTAAALAMAYLGQHRPLPIPDLPLLTTGWVPHVTLYSPSPYVPLRDLSVECARGLDGGPRQVLDSDMVVC